MSHALLALNKETPLSGRRAGDAISGGVDVLKSRFRQGKGQDVRTRRGKS